ncbi:MAG: helix-turn-helix transcriptional regulator [Bacilli bacterium]|nr:helix-turn-helix domain-containing protein [Solobacterium sp.]MDY4819830.1 helix-turn-helix transcriptional regulator [Bacilli bacterium]
MKRTLKGIRNDLNLTQKEMANKLNIPIATYQRYETGKSPIPIDIAIKIADYGNIIDLRDIKFY